MFLTDKTFQIKHLLFVLMYCCFVLFCSILFYFAYLRILEISYFLKQRILTQCKALTRMSSAMPRLSLSQHNKVKTIFQFYNHFISPDFHQLEFCKILFSKVNLYINNTACLFLILLIFYYCSHTAIEFVLKGNNHTLINKWQMTILTNQWSNPVTKFIDLSKPQNLSECSITFPTTPKWIILTGRSYLFSVQFQREHVLGTCSRYTPFLVVWTGSKENCSR